MDGRSLVTRCEAVTQAVTHGVITKDLRWPPTEMTASEPLTMEEEYSMCEEWKIDEKSTFGGHSVVLSASFNFSI